MQKIDYVIETKYGPFSDALLLEDNHGLTEEEILAMQQQRVANWISVIENPPIRPPSEYVVDNPL